MSQEAPTVKYLIISADYAGQRIDNFLRTRCKGVPKSRIYRMLRGGEVRVNKKRVKPSYVLQAADSLRIPPLRLGDTAIKVQASKTTCDILKQRIIYEDDLILVLNKPSGMAVHGGTTVRIGIIDALKVLFPQYPQLELAHRLDAETSGCLVLAKKRSVLRELHELLRTGAMVKAYTALTKGLWRPHELRVAEPLQKFFLHGGERVVKVTQAGKASLTVFAPILPFNCASLVKSQLYTGRTHQIRVHAQFRQHHIAGDERYGDKEFNTYMRQFGLTRLFLHASHIEFLLPAAQRLIKVAAPLDHDLQQVLNNLTNSQQLRHE